MMAAAILYGGSGALAGQGHAHVLQPAADAKWGPAPPMLPPGAQIAVLAGDPTKAVVADDRLHDRQPRPEHDRRYPVLVTLRVGRDVPESGGRPVQRLVP